MSIDKTALVEFLGKGVELFKTSIPTITGAILATIFLRKNTSTTEFEKIKNGFFQEATEELLSNGKITYYELYKCKNFLKIAKLADEYHNKQAKVSTSINSEAKVDFDWFINFYESAGRIGNEEMQKYWAKLLVNAVNDVQIQKKIYIDILENLSHIEAIIIEKIYSIPFDELQHKTLLTYNLPNNIEIKDDKNFDKSPDLNNAEIKLALINLSRIGCISFVKSYGGGEFYSDIHATLLGKWFNEACTIKENPT